MKKIYLLLPLITLFLFNSVSGQTITKKPIFKSPQYTTMQRLTIEEMPRGYLLFIYQNSDYQTIVKKESFSISNKNKAIELMDKLLFILEMEKTDRDEHIEDHFENVTIKRYGFNQKTVYVMNKDLKDLQLNKKRILKIKLALQKYEYTHELNK